MQVLIIEDEHHATQYLIDLLLQLEPAIEIMATLDTVEESVQWLQKNPSPELIFMDIQLADGLSFDIFKHVKVDVPVIFTTAFDQYTLRAFKINSIDYLLKPIEEKELSAALEKYQQYHNRTQQSWQELIASLHLQQGDSYRQRFLTKQGKNLNYLLVQNISYLYSDEGITFAIDKMGRRFVIDAPLDKIQMELDPKDFFRINRGQIIHLQAIHQIHSWFNHRLKIDIKPAVTELENIVSRDRVSKFKDWLDR